MNFLSSWFSGKSRIRMPATPDGGRSSPNQRFAHQALKPEGRTTSPDEPLAAGGFYAELHSIQFGTPALA